MVFLASDAQRSFHKFPDEFRLSYQQFPIRSEFLRCNVITLRIRRTANERMALEITIWSPDGMTPVILGPQGSVTTARHHLRSFFHFVKEMP